jgi:hypothetical protein
VEPVPPRCQFESGQRLRPPVAISHGLCYNFNMAKTKEKGDLGVAMVMADVLKRDYKVAIPVGEDWRYDLIVLRDSKLERVQCKYVESNGEVVIVPCRSCNNWNIVKYTPNDIDWIATYDKTTDKVYYVPSSYLGVGRACISLRLKPARNGQVKKILIASDFIKF